MKGALDIHRELLARDVPHEIVRLPRAVLQADEIPDALGLDPTRCLTVRLFVGDGRLVAVAMPAGAVADHTDLGRQLGVGTLRPATAAETNQHTDYGAGLVSPLLLPDDVDLYVDASLAAYDVVYAPTGDTGTAIGIRTADLLGVTGGRLVHCAVPAVVVLPATAMAGPAAAR